MRTPWSPDTYNRAIQFAARAHGAQSMPGSGLPYVVHLAMVCAELQGALAVEGGLDGDLAIACALLHDTLEDTDLAPDALAQAWGPAVLGGVRALSKDAKLPKGEQMADSLRRIQAQPREVWMVKLADRCANLDGAPAHWSSAKREAYRAEARVILAELGAASAHLAARLAARIDVYVTVPLSGT